MLFCLRINSAQEIDIDQTRKNLLETLQNNAINPQQKMELYVDLYDLSDDAATKHAYIRESLKLAVQLKDQTYIFETLDILCRTCKDEPDSLLYYQQL